MYGSGRSRPSISTMLVRTRRCTAPTPRAHPTGGADQGRHVRRSGQDCRPVHSGVPRRPHSDEGQCGVRGGSHSGGRGRRRVRSLRRAGDHRPIGHQPPVRLEIHSVGFDSGRRPDRLVLKWSRDNGARELRLADFAAMADPARHSYEYFSEATERLLGMPSDDWADEEFLRGVLDPADPAQVSGVLPRIREWDGWCELQRTGTTWSVGGGRHAGKPLGTAAGVSADTLSVQFAETGFAFSLTLAGKNFLAGDYWLALVREACARAQARAGDRRAAARRRASLLHPRGRQRGRRRHHLQDLSPHDLRRLQHPSLTCLDASDIGYATDCPSGLFDNSHDTVKKALDRILSDRRGARGISQAVQHVGLQPAGCRWDQDRRGCAETPLQRDRRADRVRTGTATSSSRPASRTWPPPSTHCATAATRGRTCPSSRKSSWKNDLEMRFSEFRNGLTITFSETMIGQPLSTDVFVVTLELPLRLRIPDDFQPGFPLVDFLTPQYRGGQGGVKRRNRNSALRRRSE